ncbi:sodium/proline symporter PutP [Alginatibacterium sediminis]|uniref:Sodium/proline symporter n=1 Tax=Alginatibacterium sediminis TaxID=2164068 RepID=A0A420EHK4_9ALTE|nr:sodium/proline symporter PutP [Alginatibacterium sediminis]RKF20192.1 sodium/proline symporter PutP [Alginatibacterium sediminis]
MSANSNTLIATFCIYLLLMLGVGWLAYQRTKNSSDYFLGGRSLGPWPTALSAGASDMSGWLLLGLPGFAYVAGIESIWLAIGLLFGTWANWFFQAKRLRSYSIVLDDALTIPEYLSRRFNDNQRIIQLISAMFILVFFLFYTSAGLVAGGKLFETVFQIDYRWAVSVGTVCVVSYTLFGGFLAVSWTDLIQGLLMAAALLLVPVMAIKAIDGSSLNAITEINPELLNPFTQVNGESIAIIGLISSLAWGLGYFGQPHILARFKASRSNADLSIARRIAVIWTALSMLGALAVGLAGLVYVSSHGIALEDPERIFMILVDALFSPAISGILLAAILAAIMSTADSQLLVSSSAFAEDIYKQWVRPDATSQEVMWIGRLGIIIIALCALVLAMNPESSVLGLVSYAWAGFGAAFGPVILISLYWKSMSKVGAIAGIVVGGASVVIFKQLSGNWFDLYEIVPGIVFACLAVYLGSKYFPIRDAKVEADFEACQKFLKSNP